jgi:hypothetical protein
LAAPPITEKPNAASSIYTIPWYVGEIFKPVIRIKNKSTYIW